MTLIIGLKSLFAGIVGALAFILGGVGVLTVVLGQAIILPLCQATITFHTQPVIYTFITLCCASALCYFAIFHDKENTCPPS